MKRQDYRAFNVHSNTLPKPHGTHIGTATESSLSHSAIDGADSAEDLQVFDDEQKIGDVDEKDENSGPRIKLPETLQSEPLDSKLVPRLSKKERRMYNIQKGRYEQTIKTNQKKQEHPREFKPTLEDARNFMKGEDHKDEEEEEVTELKI